MITEAPINRYPAGLLGLLDIKAMGQNPRLIQDRIQPQIDMLPFYLGGVRQTISRTTTAVTGTGAFMGAALVTDQKSYIVENFYCNGPGLGAGETVQFFIVCQIVGASGFFYTSPMSPVFVANDFVAFGSHLDTPMILPPGTAAGIIVTKIGTALPNFALGVTGFTIDT